MLLLLPVHPGDLLGLVVEELILSGEVSQREWISGAPATGRNEPHESSPLSGLKESKFERRREF